MMSYFHRYFISGLLVWLPILATLFVLKFLVDVLSNSLLLLPPEYRPDALFGFHVPGVGVLLTVVVIFLTGMIAANFLGSRLLGLWDNIMGRIPLVRSIYMGVKQVAQTLLAPGGQSFRKVLLVEYPRAGMWSLAFQTSESTPFVSEALGSDEMVSLFIPTTPNPTSGFLMMVPRKDVKEIDISVDQALKFVISLGVVPPVSKNGHEKILKDI